MDLSNYIHKGMVFVIIFFSFLLSSHDTQADYQTTLSFSGYIQSGTGDIDVDIWSAPLVNDWNGDGKIDLLVGQKNSVDETGSIIYYKNISTIDGSPSFNGSTTILACNNTCLLNVPGSG